MKFPLFPRKKADIQDTESDVPKDNDAIAEPGGPECSVTGEPVSDKEGTTLHTQKNEEPGKVTGLSVDMISEVKTLMQNLAKDFELKLKYDSTKQIQIDKLYDENQQYKDGIIRKFQNILMLTVIEQIDEASKQIAFFDKAEFSEENYRKILKSYRDIALSFQDVLLEKFDLENYSCVPGEKFDPKRQRSLKTVPTGNLDQNKQVKQSLRSGYLTSDGCILRPELVEVYVYDETLSQKAVEEEFAEANSDAPPDDRDLSENTFSGI